MLAWCHICNVDVLPELWRAHAWQVWKELCPRCGVELEDIVPDVRERIKAARVGEAGLYDPVTGRKVTHK